ncbi:MAG: isoaspartyl peptidase/L-asparaginase family protein [Caulobacteraceae bacterium]
MSGSIAMAIHGGAGALRKTDYVRELEHMRGLIEAGRDRLRAGDSARDVAVETVAEMEDCGLYVAGRGASPNAAGRYELDASLMDGPTQRVGAVACLEGFAAPIRVALAVMEKTPHVLLAGAGAAAFAAAQGLEAIDDPEAWFTRVAGGPAKSPNELATGTVGCVVLDGSGALAGGTSTAGVFGKLWGRVGDSPIAGAGVWADERVAVSCTGPGEFFIRCSASAQISWRLKFTNEDVRAAAAAVLENVRALGGEGGLIALTARGEIAMPFNSQGMKRAALHGDGTITSEVF